MKTYVPCAKESGLQHEYTGRAGRYTLKLSLNASCRCVWVLLFVITPLPHLPPSAGLRVKSKPKALLLLSQQCSSELSSNTTFRSVLWNSKLLSNHTYMEPQEGQVTQTVRPVRRYSQVRQEVMGSEVGLATTDSELQSTNQFDICRGCCMTI